MSIFDSINRTIKNVFVGSHKGEDINLETFEESSVPKAPEPVWENPLDKMPIANGSNRYAPPGRFEELEAELIEKNTMVVEENPRPEEDIAEWFSDREIENPDESDMIEEEKTIHQKMYEIATAKYNPFAIGGSENLGGGSEERLEEEFTPENDPYGGY